MSSYDRLRERYRPDSIKVLVIAESQPPADPRAATSRAFYRPGQRKDDRLFVNTIKALYPEAAELTEPILEANKELWLRRFQKDGWYMIEALPTSLPHEITKEERQQLITKSIPQLLRRVQSLVGKDTKIILVKSNVYEVAAKPLHQAGFTILNTELLDYPGRFNQRAYRIKLQKLVARI